MSKDKPISDYQGRIIEPGSFHGEEESDVMARDILAGAELRDVPDTTINQKTWCKPEYDDALIRVYQGYEQMFGTPKSVFYPACGIDASPLRGFPNSEVVFLDPCEGSVEVMRREGISVLKKGIEDYNGKHDLILLMNPHFNSVLALNNLKNGGRIIANNYFGADAAGPLLRHGVPLLKRLSLEGDKVIELPLESKVTHEQCFVFGGMK